MQSIWPSTWPMVAAQLSMTVNAAISSCTIRPQPPLNSSSYLPCTLCAPARFGLCCYPWTLWAFVLTSHLCLYSFLYLEHLFPFIHLSNIRSMLQIPAQRWPFSLWVPISLQHCLWCSSGLQPKPLVCLKPCTWCYSECILKWIRPSTYLWGAQSAEQPEKQGHC